MYNNTRVKQKDIPQDKTTLKTDEQGRAVLPGIRQIYQPDDSERKTLNFIYHERFRQMKESPERTDNIKKWDLWERQIEQFRNVRTIEESDDWQSRHVAPITIAVIQAAMSEMINQNIRPFYTPQGTEKQAKATLMQHIWDYGWFTANSDLMMYDVYWDTLGMGTAITQEYYRQDRRMVRDVIMGEDDKYEEKEREVYDYDDVYGEIVKLQNFYVDENSRGFDGAHAARDCIRRYIMDIDDFYLMYRDTKWDQFGNAEKVRPGGDVQYYEYYEPPDGIDKSRQVEVLHYWSIKPRDRFVIVANDILIRDGPNPYKHKQLPFIRWLDIKRPHKFYGKGEPELLESIQDEMNTLRRMIIDRNHLDIDKMFLVSNRIGLTDEDLIARPHGMIPTDDVNAAKAVEYGDIPRSVELSLQNLEDDAVIVTGINPRQQALPQASTATAAALMKEGTLKRIQLKLWLAQQESFTRMAQLRTENFFQFYSEPRLHKIVGKAEDQDYQNEIADLEKQGLLEVDDQGNKYMVKPRQISLKDQKISKDMKGEMTFSPHNGYSSYDLDPKDFLPLPRGGYIVRFDGGPNIQISKPLQRQSDLELFDRFAPIAMQIPGSYDIVKLGDMILTDADKNPRDLRPDNAPQDNDAQILQQSLQLAQIENSGLMQGNDIPPTPYAQPAHTRIHLLFMNSGKVKDMPVTDPIKKAFVKHVMGEMMAQQQRDQGGAVPPAPGSLGQPDNSGTMSQGGTAPGGESVPPPSLSNGNVNKPNGMAQPGIKAGTIQPNMQNGSNPNM